MRAIAGYGYRLDLRSTAGCGYRLDLRTIEGCGYRLNLPPTTGFGYKLDLRAIAGCGYRLNFRASTGHCVANNDNNLDYTLTVYGFASIKSMLVAGHCGLWLLRAIANNDNTLGS